MDKKPQRALEDGENTVFRNQTLIASQPQRCTSRTAAQTSAQHYSIHFVATACRDVHAMKMAADVRRWRDMAR